MRVLIRVRGNVDEVDLWPYVLRAEPLAEDSLLSVEVDDGRELVGVLVALTDRGLELITVQPIAPDARKDTGRDPDDNWAPDT